MKYFPTTVLFSLRSPSLSAQLKLITSSPLKLRQSSFYILIGVILGGEGWSMEPLSGA